jgi:chorismate mutase
MESFHIPEGAYGTCRTRCPRRVLATDQVPGISLRFRSKSTNGDSLIMTIAALITVRKHLDEIDQQIVALLNQRARIVAEVGKIKQEAHLPVADPAREQQILDHIVQLGGAGPLPPDRLRRIYQTVIQEMRTWEEGLAQESEDKTVK